MTGWLWKLRCLIDKTECPRYDETVHAARDVRTQMQLQSNVNAIQARQVERRVNERQRATGNWLGDALADRARDQEGNCGD